MSDYMFMLDSHLSGEQSKVLAEVRQAAERANLNLFLTGGAMRDMMGGFPIRDLDFTIEGGGTKFAKAVAQRAKAEIITFDENRNAPSCAFAGMLRRASRLRGKRGMRNPALSHNLNPRLFTKTCADVTSP